MGNFNTKLINNYTQNLKELTKMSTSDLLVEVLENFLILERKDFLKTDYENKGNGFYSRIFQGLHKNGIEIKIPRTRLNTFTPTLLELVKRNESMVQEFGLDLYISGLSSRDTSKVLKKYFSKSMSHTQIVELANAYQNWRTNWQNRKITQKYKTIFMDATHISLKREDSFTKEAVFIILGVREDNKREVIYFDVQPTESSFNYSAILKKLQSQGLVAPSIFVTDGLTGLPDQVLSIFTSSEYQLCIVHKKRNVLNKIRPKDKAKISLDLNMVFDLSILNDTVEAGQKRLDFFINKWKKKYPRIGCHFSESRKYLFTYTKYSPEVRRYIYTTNSVENLNSMLKKSTRNKYSFKNEDSLLNYIFLALKNYEEIKLTKYEVHQFRNLKKL